MFLQKNGSFLLDTPTRRANHDETEDGGQVVTSPRLTFLKHPLTLQPWADNYMSRFRVLVDHWIPSLCEAVGS